MHNLFKRTQFLLGGNMGKKLYVGNLPYSITEETLNDTFSTHGSVESVRIITDRDTGRSKGFGFIEMSSDDEANTAVDQLNGHEIDGRPLTVNEARPMAPRENRGGSGGGGGGGGGGFFKGGNSRGNRY